MLASLTYILLRILCHLHFAMPFFVPCFDFVWTINQNCIWASQRAITTNRRDATLNWLSNGGHYLNCTRRTTLGCKKKKLLIFTWILYLGEFRRTFFFVLFKFAKKSVKLDKSRNFFCYKVGLFRICCHLLKMLIWGFAKLPVMKIFRLMKFQLAII